MSNIEDYRKNIDNIDKEIVEKLEERMRVAENIAKFKQDNNLPVIDIIRERENLRKLQKWPQMIWHLTPEYYIILLWR